MAVLFATGWLITAVLMALDGPPDTISVTFSWAVMAAFGCAAAGLILYADRTAAVTIEIAEEGEITVVENTLFRRMVHVVRADEIADVVVVESEDQDGAAYFKAMVVFGNGRDVVVQEGHDHDKVLEVSRRLHDVIFHRTCD